MDEPVADEADPSEDLDRAARGLALRAPEPASRRGRVAARDAASDAVSPADRESVDPEPAEPAAPVDPEAVTGRR